MTTQNENENIITSTIDENGGGEEEEKKINNDDDEQKEIIVTNSEDENRSKRSFNSKIKYSSMPYYRSSYYANNHPYGPSPYYYYQVASINEKPTPLMVIPTQSSTTENQNGNSSQNLPPRLRQTSTNENDSNTQSSQPSQPTPTTTTTTYTRRHRSILPRGSCNYYSPHPPPPLMATPPGVLFPYPPTIHQTGHIAYNIRTPDELELLAFQQQFMNLPPPPSVIWPPGAYSHFPSYPIYEPSAYMYNNSSINNTALNPDAAEWVPIPIDNDISSSDNNILIDDDINFPPLNTNRTEENITEEKLENKSIENNSTKIEPIISNSTSSQDDNKPLSSSKLTTITYSTVILQTPEKNKSNKNSNNNNNNNNNKQYQRDNHVPTKQRTQTRVSKDISSRRRQPPSNRNLTPIEVPKQQQQPSTDDWIEVKSKKTKKFDRSMNDFHYENSSQKLVSDEQIHKTLSPLSSTGEHTTTTTTCTSEEEELSSENKVVMIVENKTIPTDYNQIIIDDIHQRLDNGEKLLIIIRGCPGSGKSTLANSLNNGYNGQILSTDEYFKDINLNDSSQFEKVHLYNHRLASDAFKRNISPIIIDNTNTTSWEMKPYVLMGKEANYDILLIEPQTPWRYKPRELVKRNLHNLPLRRIKEILNRFEHNVTVQSIIEQIKTNIYLPCQTTQQIFDQQQTDTESIDPILSTKKSFDIIDDTNILDDVRLCINDMILFLTSNFYQTSLSIPFSDLSLIPSSPTSPTTSHTLFHRSLSRFSTTTTSSSTNQDHSFSNEHLLRLPTTSFTRCFENLTPPSSTNSSIIGKKRRKNKNKQQEQSNEILLNTNNNNNNNMFDKEDYYLPQSTYNIYLPEDSGDFIVIDEQELENLTQQEDFSWDHSSTVPRQKKSTINKKSELLNIIHDEYTTPSTTISHSINHKSIQCSPNDFNQDLNYSSSRILIGHLSSSSSTVSSPLPLRPGYNECGIQVDLNENNIDTLSDLIEFYSNRVPSDIIKQFYELYNSDIQWTRTQIDEYLQHPHIISTIPTLRQLSFNALNQWNEQIKYSNPSFDTISIGDLLQDINDEELIETNEFTNSNDLNISWPMINSLQELYGEIPSISSFPDGLSLPLDDELSLNLYQALQRFLGVSNKISKPVNEKKVNRENKKQTKQQQQQFVSPKQNQSNNKTNTPSFQQIMNEELNYISTHKQPQKRQLDFASRDKLKTLERQFPTISSDVLHDIFLANESDLELTYACVSSMIDDDTPFTTPSKSPSSPVVAAAATTSSAVKSKPIAESSLESYETSRRNAENYALKRKEYFQKADQANRHGMTGVASYYINQAREQSRLIKESNRIACEYISKIRIKQFYQTHRLDLHELHADEALHLFKQIEQELNEGNKRTTLKSIEIITGYGKNSPYGGGYGKIRSVIITYLRQKNYKYSEPNKGAILVQL